MRQGDEVYRWSPSRLRRLREQYGESPELFAERVGVSARTLRYWEEGKQKPNVGGLEALCAALGIDIRSFFTKRPEPHAGSRT